MTKLKPAQLKLNLEVKGNIEWKEPPKTMTETRNRDQINTQVQQAASKLQSIFTQMLIAFIDETSKAKLEHTAEPTEKAIKPLDPAIETDPNDIETRS